MNKTRRTAYLAAFGSLWGVSEIFLGSFLSALRVPMYGALMAAIAVIIILTGALFVESRGSIIAMGLITAFLKLFSIGALFLGPLLAIMIEALLGELVISFMGRTRISFIIAGSVMVTYCFLHRFISQVLIYGKDIIEIYMGYIRLGSRMFGIPMEYAYYILFLFLILHLLFGILAGYGAWRIGNQAKTRMGLSPA